MNQLYNVIGISKQAVHKHIKRKNYFDSNLIPLISKADELKKEHPGCGVEKMYYTLQPKYLGRDKFCEIFMELGYRVKKIKNYVRTTIPTHLNYQNLIQGMEVTRPFQVVQSDITYYNLNGKHIFTLFS